MPFETPLKRTPITERELKLEARKILAQFENEEFYINRGGAGIVYDLPNGFCMKIMIDRHHSPNSHMMNLGNSIATESAFAERLSKFKSRSKARSPHYSGYIQGNAEKPGIIIMEHLNADDLQQILLGKAELPKNFNLDTFLSELELYMNDLHSQLNIAHGDFEPRNVMVDRETGLPYVIDFGRSVSLEKLTPQERQKFEQEDWNKLEALEEKLMKLTNLS